MWKTVTGKADLVIRGAQVGGENVLVIANNMRSVTWWRQLIKRWAIMMIKRVGLMAFVSFILAYLLRRSVGNVNPRAVVTRRSVIRRGTRGCGRVIRRGRGLALSSLRDEAVRMMSYTGRDLSTLKDVRRRLQEMVRRDGLFTAERIYLAPDAITAADINRTVELAMTEALTSGECEDEVSHLEMEWENLWIQHSLSQGKLMGEWGRSRLWWEYRFRLWAGLDLPLPPA